MMKPIHAAVRCLIYIGYVFLLLQMIWTETLSYYLSPTMRIFFYILLVLLFFLCFVELFRLIRLTYSEPSASSVSCHCGSHHDETRNPWKTASVYAIFIFPLVLGFTLPTKTLDSSIAQKRLVKSESSSIVKKAEQNKQVFEDYVPPESVKGSSISLTNDTYLDAITAFEYQPNLYIGRTLELEGFVFRNKEYFKKDEKFILRYAMVCCASDATPMGVLAKGDQLIAIPDDTWVRVKGKIIANPQSSFVQIGLEVTDVTVIPTPKEPYLFWKF